MSYVLVDTVIITWAQRHSLTLFTSFGDHEARYAYTSSKAGKCFQIWIDEPREGRICIHAAGVEGRKMDDLPTDWCVPLSDVEAALENAFRTIRGWMAPSERFLPKRENA